MKKLIVLFVVFLFGIAAYGQNTLSKKDGYINGSIYHCEDGVLFCKSYSDYVGPTPTRDICETLVKFPQNKNVSSYTIPDGTYVIAKGAFQGNKYIKTIRIPSTVYYIGDNVFDDCDQLTSIEIYQSTNSVRAVEADDSPSEAKEVGRYNIQGVKVQEGEDGKIQIILYSDGTAKKVTK